ncbi:hypothetical protein GCM10010919_03320 [Alishewanella longhuensis]|uniref:diguanylate cyclase n=1 Tax=Alishewanella longhuensis TaxID=1091037 RepID=A0ABQ3KTK9_9ALTE|nr:diguanylate cyclase [Alishewanella longhuensis]GHG60133.1 hypothetical protein GCM10010919_03320 [Alishewanella longhuensis]
MLRKPLTNIFFLSLILMLGWVLLYQGARLLEYSPHASLWYPPAALSFAGMVLLGIKLFPAFFSICLLMSILHFQQNQAAEPVAYLTTVLPALAHAGSYLLGAMLLRLLIRTKKVNYTGLVVAYLLLAAIAAFLAAFTGSWSLQFAGIIDNAERQSIWLSWWIGDLVALITLSPLFILLLDKRSLKLLKTQAPSLFDSHANPFTGFVIKVSICLLFLSVSMLLAHQIRTLELSFFILFLSLPAMWLVYTESVWRSFSCLALMSLTIVCLMAALNLLEFAAIYQFTMAMIAVSMLYGTVVPLLQTTNQQLQLSLQTDMLTGVLSRQGFIEQAEMLIAHTNRRKDRICLAVLDLDHFKEVNDVLGHQVGDNVLQQVCRKLEQQLRQDDLLGRFGGDELMLLLPNTSAKDALALCERLRLSIEQLHIAVLDKQVSISIGVCEQKPLESFSQLFARADQALFHAKQAGRNQVYCSA